MTLTPTQQKLYDTIRNLHGGDKGYADLDWRMVEEVMGEARESEYCTFHQKSVDFFKTEEHAAIIAEVEKLTFTEKSLGLDNFQIGFNSALIQILELIRKRGV